MESVILGIFVLVYLGMVLGTWPGFALDRTGIALLGAIAIIEVSGLTLNQALNAIDIPTLAILFSFMILSAQFYFSGFYTHITDRMGQWDISPSYFLLAVIMIAGILSAVLINDIVCLAMTPLLIRICIRKKLNPLPFLIGLACASNIGSALTLIGNPQNMLIGQVLQIPFKQYTLDALIPCVLGFLITWLVIQWQTAGQWFQEGHESSFETIAYNRWQSNKGLIILLILLTFFFLFDLPRDHLSLIAGGALLLSRQMASKMMLSFIDWQLLVLFIGLFIVNQTFNQLEVVQSFFTIIQENYVNLHHATPLFFSSVILSNVISNVPAVMLLIPFATTPASGSLLALSSTFAGNLLIIGSIANIIVVSQASHFGIDLSWKRHLKSGVPITLMTLVMTGAWLYLRY